MFILDLDLSSLNKFVKNEDKNLVLLDSYSFEDLIGLKIEKFLKQMNQFYVNGLYDIFIKKTEKVLISKILNKTDGNQMKCAKILGISRNTLRKKIYLHNIINK